MNNATTVQTRPNGIRIGEILVAQGMLSRDEVQQILAAQQRYGRPFGVLAEQLFGLDPRVVEGAWVKQYATLANVADLNAIDVDDDCIRLINRRQAWQFQIATVAHEDDELIIVTDERHLARALRFAAATFSEPTFFKIVETERLQELLMDYYPVPEFLAQFAATR